MRRQLQSEIGKNELEDKIVQLEQRKQKLKEERIDLLNQENSLDKKIKKRNQIKEQKEKRKLNLLNIKDSIQNHFLKLFSQN
ncbi:unnamed protein product [Paramecium primaurelia]|uniref:Uncharacterized protein n=1 Tax=Paramecium primaurelia TaxID=5886 RepID=A0A8S1PBU4_PARPR|nr:unnamed protein product [Paramecium primaurelia]